MAQVNLADAKARLSELVDRAVAGEVVIIARRNQPVVRLVPESALGSRSILGLFAGGITMGDDFDAPLEGFEDLGG